MVKKLYKILSPAILVGALGLSMGCHFINPTSEKHPFIGKGVTVTYDGHGYKINLHLNRSTYVDYEHQAMGRDLKDKTDYLTVRFFPKSENVKLKDEKCDGLVDAIIENSNTILRSEENEERFKEADKKFAFYSEKMQSILDMVNQEWKEHYRGVF